MLSRLKLLHHQHTGQLHAHEHTSYIPLAVVLLAVGFALVTYSVSAQSPGPEERSIGLTGVVPGDPPTQPAIITSPRNGERFNNSPIAVTGTCPQDTLVEILKNNIFAGSALCGSDGRFTVNIDLLFGRNVLTARVFDAINQEGPVSDSVTVHYDALPPQAGPLTSLDFDGAQLLLNTDAVYRGMFPQQEFNIPIEILGGTPPYAVNVQWGDENNKVVPRPNNTPFRVDHAYQRPGTYQITLQATDTVGRVAFLSVAAIVNGQPSVAASEGPKGATTNRLLLLWPVYVGAVGVLISFWLGEQRERRLLAKHGVIPSAQGPAYH
jgi:hypothetical protein